MSERALRIAIGALAIIGLGIAGYLTYVHYRGIAPACTTGGCETVQTSSYAKLAGVPVPLLGLIGYVFVLASTLSRSEVARMGGALVALVGFGFSLYLTYLELFTINAICQWCVGSAIVMTLICILAVTRMLTADPDGGAIARSTPAAPSR